VDASTWSLAWNGPIAVHVSQCHEDICIAVAVSHLGLVWMRIREGIAQMLELEGSASMDLRDEKDA
jgi:hypothetical protein